MRVSVYQNFEDIEEIWNKSEQRTPFQSYEWNKLFWKHLKGNKELFIYASEKTILPFQLRNIGKLRVLELIGTRGSDYLDYIGSTNDLIEIYNIIFNIEIYDVIRLEDISDRSQMTSISAPGLIVEKKVNVICISIKLPTKYSLRTRKDIYQYKAHLKRSFSEIDFVFKDDISNLRAYINIHRNRQRIKNKKKYLSEEAQYFLEEYFTSMYAREKLFLSGLYLSRRLVAGIISIPWQKTIYAFYTGYDMAYAQYEVGWLLYDYVLNEAQKNGFNEYDLSRGDEDYKYKLGGISKNNMLIEIARNKEILFEYRQQYQNRFKDVGYEPTKI